MESNSEEKEIDINRPKIFFGPITAEELEYSWRFRKAVKQAREQSGAIRCNQMTVYSPAKEECTQAQEKEEVPHNQEVPHKLLTVATVEGESAQVQDEIVQEKDQEEVAVTHVKVPHAQEEEKVAYGKEVTMAQEKEVVQCQDVAWVLVEVSQGPDEIAQGKFVQGQEEVQVSLTQEKIIEAQKDVSQDQEMILVQAETAQAQVKEVVHDLEEVVEAQVEVSQDKVVQYQEEVALIQDYSIHKSVNESNFETSSLGLLDNISLKFIDESFDSIEENITEKSHFKEDIDNPDCNFLLNNLKDMSISKKPYDIVYSEEYSMISIDDDSKIGQDVEMEEKVPIGFNAEQPLSYERNKTIVFNENLVMPGRERIEECSIKVNEDNVQFVAEDFSYVIGNPVKGTVNTKINHIHTPENLIEKLEGECISNYFENVTCYDQVNTNGKHIDTEISGSKIETTIEEVPCLVNGLVQPGELSNKESSFQLCANTSCINKSVQGALEHIHDDLSETIEISIKETSNNITLPVHKVPLEESSFQGNNEFPELIANSMSLVQETRNDIANFVPLDSCKTTSDKLIELKSEKAENNFKAVVDSVSFDTSLKLQSTLEKIKSVDIVNFEQNIQESKLSTELIENGNTLKELGGTVCNASLLNDCQVTMEELIKLKCEDVMCVQSEADSVLIVTPSKSNIKCQANILELGTSAIGRLQSPSMHSNNSAISLVEQVSTFTSVNNDNKNMEEDLSYMSIAESVESSPVVHPNVWSYRLPPESPVASNASSNPDRIVNSPTCSDFGTPISMKSVKSSTTPLNEFTSNNFKLNSPCFKIPRDGYKTGKTTTPAKSNSVKNNNPVKNFTPIKKYTPVKDSTSSASQAMVKRVSPKSTVTTANNTSLKNSLVTPTVKITPPTPEQKSDAPKIDSTCSAQTNQKVNSSENHKPSRIALFNKTQGCTPKKVETSESKLKCVSSAVGSVRTTPHSKTQFHSRLASPKFFFQGRNSSNASKSIQQITPVKKNQNFNAGHTPAKIGNKFTRMVNMEESSSSKTWNINSNYNIHRGIPKPNSTPSTSKRPNHVLTPISHERDLKKTKNGPSVLSPVRHYINNTPRAVVQRNVTPLKVNKLDTGMALLSKENFDTNNLPCKQLKPVCYIESKKIVKTDNRSPGFPMIGDRQRKHFTNPSPTVQRFQSKIKSNVLVNRPQQNDQSYASLPSASGDGDTSVWVNY